MVIIIIVGWVLHFVWLEVLTTLVVDNNPINTFLINPNIISYYFSSLNTGKY